MKKILTTFLTLFCFIFILVLPLYLGLHASMMLHHDMSAEDCVEHCMESETSLYIPKMLMGASYMEVIVTKIFFSKIFDFTLPLALLFIIIIYAPPNLYLRIHNYNYSSLIGVVKLTT